MAANPAARVLIVCMRMNGSVESMSRNNKMDSFDSSIYHLCFIVEVLNFFSCTRLGARFGRRKGFTGPLGKLDFQIT